MALLDLIVGYDCNLACDYCTITPAMRARALSTAEVLAALRRGRDAGYDAVSFTGGEPTIRRDLVALVRAARALGFTDIKVQSNGLVYAQPRNVEALCTAGVNRFHISIHTHDAAAYERLVQRDGTFALMEAGLRNVAAAGVTLVADVILKRDTYGKLPDAIDWLRARGVRDVHLWFVSLTDGNRDNVESMPRMTEVVPVMRQAFLRGRPHQMRILSLHVPRCLLGDVADHAYDPGADRVLVVTPEASFELRDSRLAGQAHVPACEGCSWRPICPGLRRDYLERFGDDEIAAARGQPPRVPATRRLPLAGER